MNEKIQTFLTLCVGACTGTFIRYMIYSSLQKYSQPFYLATIIVNLLGSFLIGIIFIILSQHSSPKLQTLIITGLLASLTTFSTLSLDTVKLITNGQFVTAISYVSFQIISGISFCYFGVRIGQKLI